MKKQLDGLEPGTPILFANFPADGHFNPLTGLAVHLKKMGCDVRWYTSRKYAEKINRLGIPFYGLKRAVDVGAHSDIDRIFPERRNHKSQVSKLKFDMVHAFILRSPEYYEDILEIHREFPFELMIADITFGGIPFVKEKMNIPVMAVSVVPLPETSRDLPPSGLGLTPSKTVAGRIRQSLLRFLADRLIFAHPTRVMRRMLTDHDIDPGKSNVFDILIQKSTLVLQSGTPGFEYERSDMSGHIFFAGPLLPFTPKKDRESWYDPRLELYKKIILVTQGTVEKDIDKLVVPALEGFRNSDFLVIVTTGGSQTSRLRKRFPDNNFIIEDFIPFADVMPYVQLYISNGGYGGVLLSIQNGVPMVVAGVHEGKNEINARVDYFGLGINLRTEKPSAMQIRQAAEKIFRNPGYRNRVAKLRDEFNQYQPGTICARHAARLLRLQKKSGIRIPSASEFIY